MPDTPNIETIRAAIAEIVDDVESGVLAWHDIGERATNSVGQLRAALQLLSTDTESPDAGAMQFLMTPARIRIAARRVEDAYPDAASYLRDLAKVFDIEVARLAATSKQSSAVAAPAAQGEAVAYQLRCNGGYWGMCGIETFKRGRCDVAGHMCEVRALYTTPQPSAPGVDVQALIEAVLPGGSSCDPQRVADDIRMWFAERAAAAPPPAHGVELKEGEFGFSLNRTNESLVDCALQVYARACRYETEHLHTAAMQYRMEILRRLAAQPSADDAPPCDYYVVRGEGLTDILSYGEPPPHTIEWAVRHGHTIVKLYAAPPADARDATRVLLNQAIDAMSKLRQSLEFPGKHGGLYVFPEEAVRKFTDEQARLMYEEKQLAAVAQAGVTDSDRLEFLMRHFPGSAARTAGITWRANTIDDYRVAIDRAMGGG